MTRGDTSDRDAGMYESACSNQFTDVQFRVGDQTFGAHRVVLCNGSPFFARMLTSDFLESHAQQPIPIKDISIDTFEVVLRFLYMGASAFKTIPTMDLCEVLQVADRYCLPNMVELCIEAVCDGQITASNCLALLDTACELGGHGRAPLWSPLFQACAEYVAENLVEMLDRWDGQPVSLGLAGMCRLVELASPKVVAEPLLLRRLWRFVKAWGRDALGAHDLQSFFARLMRWKFEDTDYLDGADFTLEIEGLDLANSGWEEEWRSAAFNAGGFFFHFYVEEAVRDGKAWYGVFLQREPTNDAWSSWCCDTLSQFRWLHSSSSPEKDRLQFMGTFFPAQKTHVGWGFPELLGVEEAHAPGAGYVEGGRATVRVTVKVNPLVGLCTAAAFLDDAASPAYVLRAITHVEMLSDMLVADSLPIESEDALLAALADFADSDASEEHAEKVAALVPALRLEHVDFDRLVSAARASPGLRTCREFSDMLHAYLERALARPAVPSGQAQAARAPRRGAVWRSLQGSAGTGAPPPHPPPQPPDVRALVRCLLCPPQGAEDLAQLLHASLEVQEQVEAQLRESREARSTLPPAAPAAPGGHARLPRGKGRRSKGSKLR